MDLAGGEGGRRSSRRRGRETLVSGISWLVIVAGILGLVVLTADLAHPIRTCPSWVVSDGGLPVGPGPADSDLYRELPADEVPGYEATAQPVPPLIRCQPPGSSAWSPVATPGSTSVPITIDRWTARSVIGLAVLEVVAVTALVLVARRRKPIPA